MEGKAYIGTSGWQYAHWRGKFYPEDLPTTHWLNYYSCHFKTVEINSSFYHQVRSSTFQKWQEQTHADFVFSVKGHRFITHIKRLTDREAVRKFFKNVSVLAKRGEAHIVLWQFPYNFQKNEERLKEFLKALPSDFRYAFEFRHKSWIDRKVVDILKKGKVKSTVVLQDWKAWPSIQDYSSILGTNWLLNLPFVYIRFHGSDVLYTSCYSDDQLRNWAKKIVGWREAGLDVYAYFNNDSLGFAVPNAKRLIEFVQD